MLPNTRWNQLVKPHRVNLERLEDRYCFSVGAFVKQELIGPTSEDIYVVKVLDIDFDHDLDIQVSKSNDAHSWWMQNIDGRGAFAPLASTELPAGLLADIDGDDRIDVVSSRLYRPPDSFRTYTLIEWIPGGGGENRELGRIADDAISKLEVVDADGDHDQDVLLWTNDMASSPSWFENTDGKGTFSARKFIGGNSFLDFGDIDGDGDFDALTFTPNGQWYSWLELRDGEFSEHLLHPVDFIIGPMGDFDSDGDLDILGREIEGKGKLFWYENEIESGVVKFERQHPLAENVRYDVHSADADGDGDVDILYQQLESVFWLENIDGRGQFAQPSNLLLYQLPNAYPLEMADFDGDHDLDLLHLDRVFSKSSVTLYEQRMVGDTNDDGQFTSEDLVAVFAVGEYEDEVARNSVFNDGDWNQDGDFNSSDLVLAFSKGKYEAQPPAAQPIPSPFDLIVGDVLARSQKRKLTRWTSDQSS